MIPHISSRTCEAPTAAASGLAVSLISLAGCWSGTLGAGERYGSTRLAMGAAASFAMLRVSRREGSMALTTVATVTGKASG